MTDGLTQLLVAICHTRFGGDPERMLADADLGSRVREKNRHAARQRRERDEDPDFVEALTRLRRRAPTISCNRIADLLLADFGRLACVDPRQALAKRVARCLRRNHQDT